MLRRIAVVGGMVLVLALGAPGALAAPAGAGAEAPVSGWVVENQDPDGMFTAVDGSVTVAGLGDGPMTCVTTDGWGIADSGTIRPQDVFGEMGVTTYVSGCTGGPPGLEMYSAPGTVLWPGSYDAATDRVTGEAYPWLWAMWVAAPDCDVDLYAVDPFAGAPLTFDNATATLAYGPIEAEVTAAEGTGCDGVAAVGDRATVEITIVASPGFTVHPLP